jgi:hypothetical protein
MALGLGFGKSKQKSQSTSSSESESGNRFADFLRDQYAPTTEYATGAGNALQQLLFGGASQNQGFQNFRDNSGYDFLFGEGQRALNNKFSGAGLYNSGARAKALTKYGQDQASTSLNQYIAQLLGLSQLGLSGGNLISDAGKYSEASSASQSTGKASSFNASAKLG